jgi:hypothetical protein
MLPRILGTPGDVVEERPADFVRAEIDAQAYELGEDLLEIYEEIERQALPYEFATRYEILQEALRKRKEKRMAPSEIQGLTELVDSKVIEKVACVRCERGDVFVLTLPVGMRLTAGDERLKEQINDILPGVEVMVLEDGMKFDIIKKGSADDH